jgi:UPF0271 protein
MTIINCDMGESFGLYRIGDDEALMPLISVANVACGFHASDFNHMATTVQDARRHGVRVGAHPSLPDLQGFGRREMVMPREELANCMIYQIGALKGFLDAAGMPLNHIKPHGALYGMAGTLHEKIYTLRGHKLIAEFYADLQYRGDGSLIITREHETVDPVEAAARSLRAIREGKTRSVDGNDISVGADAICVHSDTPNAVAVAEAVREAIRPHLAA